MALKTPEGNQRRLKNARERLDIPQGSTRSAVGRIMDTDVEVL